MTGDTCIFKGRFTLDYEKNRDEALKKARSRSPLSESWPPKSKQAFTPSPHRSKDFAEFSDSAEEMIAKIRRQCGFKGKRKQPAKPRRRYQKFRLSEDRLDEAFPPKDSS